MNPLGEALAGLLVLSLGVERLAAVLRLRDWQPLRRFRRLKVSLPSARELLSPTSDRKDEWPAAVDQRSRKRLIRDVFAENTLVLGIMVAIVTGFDALVSLGSVQSTSAAIEMLCGRIIANGENVAHWTLSAIRIAVTGAAAGAGASLWHELLVSLADNRRGARRQIHQPVPASAPSLGAIEELKEAARCHIPELRRIDGVSDVRVGFIVESDPDHPGVEFHVTASAAAKSRLPHSLIVSTSNGEAVVPVVLIEQ